MSLCTLVKTLFIVSMGTCFLLAGCGKKAKEKSNGTPEVVTPPQTEIDAYLEKQSVSCEGTQACPNYMTKIVVVFGNEKRICTGFLTSDTVVATSSRCLPDFLRLNGSGCKKEVHFFFPKSGNRPAERVACANVIMASPIRDRDDPNLTRDDTAFLELEKPVAFRRQASINRKGIQSNKQYTTWMIDQVDESNAIVKKSTCEGVHGSYVNPLALNESSPSMTFSDCPLSNGGSGAPVLDAQGKVRAMLSKEMSSSLRKYIEDTGLLTQPLRVILHGTNFACAPTTTDNDMLDEKECLKDLTETRVDRARSEMVSTNFLFGELRKKLEDSLQNVSKFVRFGVKLIPKKDVQETEIYPKCFKPLNTWLPDMGTNRSVYVDDIPLPVKSFKRTMDSFGKIVGTTIESPERQTFIQFSLKSLRSTKRSAILMWLPTSSNDVRTFQNIGEECSSSLL